MNDIGGGMIGLVAVILSLGIPMAAMYTYFRIRKLQADERLTSEQTAALQQFAVRRIETVLQREDRLHAAAQIFGPAKADAAAVRLSVHHLDIGMSRLIVDVHDARVGQAVQRDRTLSVRGPGENRQREQRNSLLHDVSIH